MVAKQEYSHEQAQDDLQRVAIPWAEEHASRPGSNISVIYPDLENHPEQDVDEFVSWAEPLPGWLPENLFLLGSYYTLAKVLGGNAVRGWTMAGQMLQDLRRTPAYAHQPNGPSVAQQIIADVEAGKNLVQATPHQDLVDVGIAALATLLATRKVSYATETNFVPLSPVMKFENYRGKNMSEASRQLTNRVWVFPQTPSANKRDIPRRLRLRMGRGVQEIMGPILDDPNRGTIMYEALTGSAMIPTYDQGHLTALAFPEVYDSAASALHSTDKALPFALFKNPENGNISWEIGHFIDKDSIDADSDSDQEVMFMDRIMRDLEIRMRRLAGVPVKYSRPPRAAELLREVPDVANSIN